MEDQRRDIVVKGVWFLALMFSSLVFSVRCQSNPSMTLEVSPNMTVQQEGTTVSLLCQVYGFNASTHFLSWVKEGSGSFVVTSTDLSVYRNERYLVSFTKGLISTFNLTFTEVKTTDTGTYQCNLIHPTGEMSFVGVLDKKLVLSVYPRDAFPSCNPNGPGTVNTGSFISCSTSGNATASISADNDEWTLYYSYQHGGIALLLKNVTTSDNSQTYICVANLPPSDMNLSCTIGPLNVVDIESTTIPTITTRPTGVAVVTPGLSAGQITGIVIGVLVLVIIIAIHTMCCRCDPRRWFHPKDYLIDCGSSRKTPQAHEDTSRSPPDVVSRDSYEVPPSYNSVLEEQSVSVSQPGRPGVESNIYAESSIVTREPDMNISLRLNLNIAVAGANVSSEVKQPSDQESSVGIPPKPHDDTDQTHATTGRNHSERGRPGASDPPQQSPQIYAQVIKPRGNNADASGGTSQSEDTTGQPPQPLRKPKKFSRREEIPDKMEQGSSQTVVYADLDLEKEGQDENKQLVNPQETLYADIRV
ncbi:uncharacterized protein [Asterias amurensis]|uniref:uncharacterized protein n=1 Tax=Asterias amurensis TaxID=7602 RepID=UPI003AB1B928